MFEILMFLLENYMEGSVVLKTDTHALIQELEIMGFDGQEIHRAFCWLNGLQQFQTTVENGKLTPNALRHYLPEEAELLGLEGQNLLLYLEKINIIDPITREIVIDRIMALDESKEIELGRIKWIILLVLFNQPNKKSSLQLMQEMVLADAFDVLH